MVLSKKYFLPIKSSRQGASITNQSLNQLLHYLLHRGNENNTHPYPLNISGDVSKGELGVTAVPGKEDEFKQNFKTTIDYAKAVQARKVHIMAGKMDSVTPQNWETYENNLKYAADILRAENLVGLIEPINQYSVPKYFLSDFNKGTMDVCVIS